MNSGDNTEETWLATPARPLALVVDDDDAIREALGDLLEDAGFDTVRARNGLEALNILGALATAPMFILLDLTMPIMDGWAFCDMRRRFRRFREVSVIAISAAEISESNRPTGIDAFLSKPIDLDRFAQLVGGMSGRRRSHSLPIGVLH